MATKREGGPVPLAELMKAKVGALFFLLDAGRSLASGVCVVFVEFALEWLFTQLCLPS